MVMEKEQQLIKVIGKEEEDEIVEDYDELESRKKELLKTLPQDWNSVHATIQHILSKGRVSSIALAYKIGSVLEKYQGHGQLLKPYLNDTVRPLMTLIRSKTTELGPKSKNLHEDVIKPVCIIIYSLIAICGHDPVMKYFPHQASDVDLAVPLLEQFLHSKRNMYSLRVEKHGYIELKCVMLLWLYYIVLDPSDDLPVDTIAGEEPKKPRKVLRLVEYCKDFLFEISPMRTKAAALLPRIFSRPDMIKPFSSFMNWAHEVLCVMDKDKIIQTIGAAQALDPIFKICSKKQLLSVVPILWPDTSDLFKSKTAAMSPVLRKHLLKLAQRIAFLLLPQPSPSWNYVRKHTTLGQHISSNGTKDTNKTNPVEDVDTPSLDQDASSVPPNDVDVPKLTEEIIELLLSGLKDPDIIVRWSAAKGIGRVASRLTSARAEEVLSSVLELFSPGEGHTSWHGGCLALSALACNGSLLPTSFPKVIPVLEKALHYDVRKGPHSGGSHIREAAAYVCWAFGRAYDHTDMKIVLEKLAPHLLTVACYDREVNSRRAASAAFQENVGRQGDYPHGIDIVNATDYFSLLSRENSYLHVAVCVAQYDKYLNALVNELLYSKLCHWDKDLRELAAKALSALVKNEPAYFSTVVLEKLVPCTLSPNFRMRHGATLAAGQVVLALHKHGVVLSTDMRKQVARVVPAIEKARLYRGKAGDIMRYAVSHFIGCISQAHIRLSVKIKQRLLNTLNENVKHPNSNIQNAAVEALKHFAPFYLAITEKKGTTDIVTKYVEQLTDSNVSARRGSALAIGVLPFKFLAKRWQDVLSKLCTSCAVKDNPEDNDAETRMNAVKGLAAVCETLTKTKKHSAFFSEEDSKTLYLFIKNEVMECLFKALDDYSVDKRDDVGSRIREAAIIGLEKCTYILCKKDSESFSDANLSTRLIGGIIKQAVEKVDKLRELAGKVLRRILYNETTSVPFIPEREKLQSIAPNEENLKWGAPTFAYRRFVQLLEISAYSKYVLSGLVVAVGGFRLSLRMASLSALMGYLRMKGTKDLNRSRELSLGKDILWVLQEYKGRDRVIAPTLQVIEILFSKKVLSNMEEGYTPVFCAGVMDSLTTELEGSKDHHKKYAGIGILGHITSLSDPIRNRAFAHLLSFLNDSYFMVREATAEQVYLLVKEHENLVEAAKREKALKILFETHWGCSVKEATKKMQQLCEVANVQTGELGKAS